MTEGKDNGCHAYANCALLYVLDEEHEGDGWQTLDLLIKEAKLSFVTDGFSSQSVSRCEAGGAHVVFYTVILHISSNRHHTHTHTYSSLILIITIQEFNKNHRKRGILLDCTIASLLKRNSHLCV